MLALNKIQEIEDNVEKDSDYGGDLYRLFPEVVKQEKMKSELGISQPVDEQVAPGLGDTEQDSYSTDDIRQRVKFLSSSAVREATSIFSIEVYDQLIQEYEQSENTKQLLDGLKQSFSYQKQRVEDPESGNEILPDSPGIDHLDRLYIEIFNEIDDRIEELPQ